MSNSLFASWKWYIQEESDTRRPKYDTFPYAFSTKFHTHISSFCFYKKPSNILISFICTSYLDFFHKLHMEKGMYSISTLKGRNGFPYILNYFFHTNSESLRITIKKRNKWIIGILTAFLGSK